jgi:integrase
LPKRGKGEGTIRRRSDGRWEARLRLESGERRSYYGSTRQEVAREMTAALRDQQLGLATLNERQSVGDYLTAWIEIYCQRRRPTSYERYERTVRRHLLPRLGKIPLAKLTPQHVEAFYSKKLAAGDSPSTVRFCHKVLRAALNDALRLGLVHRNAASLVEPPRVHSQEMAYYTEEQARTLLQAVSGHRLEALIMLALATGMREGYE